MNDEQTWTFTVCVQVTGSEAEAIAIQDDITDALTDASGDWPYLAELVQIEVTPPVPASAGARP